MNVHTYLVKPPANGGEEKVAGALIFADCLQVFAAVYMQLPLGLIRGNGIGLLATWAHARLFPAQQPAERKREWGSQLPGSLQWLCSTEQKGHFLVWNSAFRDFDGKVDINLHPGGWKKRTRRWKVPHAGPLMVLCGSVASGSVQLSGLSFGFLSSVVVFAALLRVSSSSHLAKPSSRYCLLVHFTLFNLSGQVDRIYTRAYLQNGRHPHSIVCRFQVNLGFWGHKWRQTKPLQELTAAEVVAVVFISNLPALNCMTQTLSQLKWGGWGCGLQILVAQFNFTWNSCLVTV